MYFKHHNKASELKKVGCRKLPEPCSSPGLIPFLKQGEMSHPGGLRLTVVCWRSDRAKPPISGPVKFPQIFIGFCWLHGGESMGKS